MGRKIKRFLSGLAVTGLLVSPVQAMAQSVPVSGKAPTISIKSATVLRSAPSIPVQIDGKVYTGIVYKNTTYVLWAALKLMDTPYTYAGEGIFLVAGYQVDGIVYKGQTYLPWYTLNGSNGVNSIHLTTGGWNFTHKFSDTSTDGYKLDVLFPYNTTTTGKFQPLWVRTFKADGTPIDGKGISIWDKSNIPGYGSGGVTDMNTNGGSYYWAETLGQPGVDTITVTWDDPSGVTHTDVLTLTVSNPVSTDTPIPPDETMVAQTPAQFTNDQVLFNSTVAGQAIQWQLDTGAMSPVLNGTDAAKLHLTNEGNIQIQGVTGSGTAYVSHIDVTIGGVTFNHVLCLVFPNMQTNSLFGFSFFAGDDPTTGIQGTKYDLLISQKHNTLTILK